MYTNKKIKNTKTLEIKYKVLFIDRLKAIENTIRFFLLFIFYIFFYLDF